MIARCRVGVLSVMLIAVFLQSCVYFRVQRPLDTDFDNTTLGTKTGVSHSYSVMWLVAWGDSGTKAAAENGDITTIMHADVKYLLVLFGVYTRLTTVVYGD